MDGERLRRLALAGDEVAQVEWWRWLDRRAERCAEGEGECEVWWRVLWAKPIAVRRLGQRSADATEAATELCSPAPHCVLWLGEGEVATAVELCGGPGREWRREWVPF